MKTSKDSRIIVPRADGLGYEIKEEGGLFKVFVFHPGGGWICVNSLRSEAGAIAYGEQCSRRAVDDRYGTDYALSAREDREYRSDYRSTMRPEYMR
jgi:hypothetical protein